MPKALLVTDSNWVRNDVIASLSIGGWQIEETDDPSIVVSTIEALEPDVVITDLQVGSMGGMAIVRSIRGSFQADARPRLVMLLDRSADTFIAGRAGVDAAVIKPFTAHELRSAVGEFPAEPVPPNAHSEPGGAEPMPVQGRKAAPKAR